MYAMWAQHLMTGTQRTGQSLAFCYLLCSLLPQAAGIVEHGTAELSTRVEGGARGRLAEAATTHACQQPPSGACYVCKTFAQLCYLQAESFDSVRYSAVIRPGQDECFIDLDSTTFEIVCCGVHERLT